MWHLVAIAVISIASYYGTRILFPPTKCNMALQDFVLNDVPIFWKVIEGPCSSDDPDYSHVEFNVEEMLVDDENDVWPEALCQYGEIYEARYIFVYGTDKEKVDTIDCYQPLNDLKEEIQDNPSEILRNFF